ncbi:Short-chain dehydrogenase PC-15 [Pseudocercospora fuligena]|uniref:Short-chain dehydrogenase PC-15 n=1 Tax=Pseudocercospora fuligena TaxID=685502 RepID=A0A8H6RE62_9PEZI|nr:Short-chain dehydrogenase PC-15 [Pseudocercospora fuligena]
MESLSALGIETQSLDITSDGSIEECVAKVKRLDILVNNSGASYTMPIVDTPLLEAKKIFDVNVWGHLAVTQAFLPLLLKSSRPMIVNHTTTGVHISIPWQAVYNASKAAMSRFSDTLRLELQPSGVQVVELKTGGVKTKILSNLQARNPKLPAESIYMPAKDTVEEMLKVEWAEEHSSVSAEQWAEEVVADILKKNPPPVIWRGESAWMARLASVLPFGWLDGTFKQMTGLDKVEAIIRKQ